MESRATAKYIRVSSSKIRRYANAIKGKKYTEACAILDFMPSPNAELLKKVLVSAGANAEENLSLTKENLIVKNAIANEGPTLKRMRPGPMGRGMRIRKRTSHITVVLATEK